MSSSLSRAPHGVTGGGAAVELFTLATANGCVAQVSTFGATLTSLRLGGAEVAPCHSDVAQLEQRASNPYLGATVGRVANRTGAARVRGLAEGEPDLAPPGRLAANDGANSLHGGRRGFDAQVWRVEWTRVGEGFAAVALALTSPDGDEGYPGALEARVVYSLYEGGSSGGVPAVSDACAVCVC